MLSANEVANHNTSKDLWVIIHGKAYDVTEFLPEHPGGPAIILKYAGKDATLVHEMSRRELINARKAYEPIHPPNVLDDYLPKEKHLGQVDKETLKVEKAEVTAEDREILQARSSILISRLSAKSC